MKSMTPDPESPSAKKNRLAWDANLKKLKDGGISRDFDERDAFMRSASGAFGKPMDADSEADDEESSLLAACLPTGSSHGGEAPRKRGCCERLRAFASVLTKADYFKVLIAVMIVANTMAMAVQIDHGECTVTMFGRQMGFWTLLNNTFLIIFTAEITLRLIAGGIRGFFFDDDDWLWNWFDFLIVFFAVCDQVVLQTILPAILGTSRQDRNSVAVRAVMAARTLRIARVLRVLRIFRAFKKLRLLVRGMIESLQVVFWIFILTLMMIFVCAIVCTTAIGQNITDFPEEDRPDIEEYWGSVARSMLTLFQFLTMDGWGELYQQVVRTMPYMVFFFFPFVFVGAFVIMSLLTGVMADHMNDVRCDEEAEERKQRVMQLDSAVTAIREQDVNRDGLLDRSEFRKLFDERASSFAKDLKDVGLPLTPWEAAELFDWFDVDGDNAIDYEELRHGVKQLYEANIYEGLTALQLFRLGTSVRSAAQFVDLNLKEGGLPWPSSWGSAERVPQRQAEDRHQLESLDARLAALEETTTRVDNALLAFMDSFGWRPDSVSRESDASLEFSAG